MTPAALIEKLLLAGVAAPFALVIAVGLPMLAARPLPEYVVRRLARLAFGGALWCLAAAALGMVVARTGRIEFSIGRWFAAGGHVFDLRLLADGYGVPFALFCALLCHVVAIFADRYMHREAGYNRMFLMLALFGSGMLLVALAGSIELLFAGWELIGLSSALLVAFFHERPAAVRNGLFTFVVYRLSDLALAGAAVFIHHAQGSGALLPLLDSHAASLSAGLATFIAFHLLVAAAGKCAQLPFSSWLPRAMEGPTPSSAIFYGALSIHAGAFLLLRFAPLVERSPAACATLVALGLATALYATLVARAQTDIKSALAFASLTQVGIVLAEIGLGLRWLPLVHIIGHGCVRSLQFLRAPSLLHDLHRLGALEHHASGGANPRAGGRLYHFALERGGADALIERLAVAPFLFLFRRLDALERRWCALLSGTSDE